MYFRISHIIFWAAMAFSCTVSALFAGNLPVLSADNPLEYDQTTQELVATGHAQFSHNQLLLESDTIRFSRENQLASIIGNPYVTSESLRLNAEKIVYDLGKRSFKAYNYRCLQVSSQDTTYLKGPIIEGDSKLMLAERGVHYISLKGCSDPHPTDVSIWSRKMEYHAGEYIIGRHNFFMIGKVPAFYLPYFRKSLDDNLIVLTHTYGSSKPLGYFLKTNIIARFDPSFKLGMMLDYYSHRGILAGPLVFYDVKRPLTDFKGELTWGYIRDRGRVDRRGTDILGKPIPYYRYFLEWGHQQKFLESRRLKLTGNLSYWRDSEVMKDFRPERFLTGQNPDTFEELVYRKEDLFITGFTRLRPNNFQSIIKRAPEVTFEFLPTPLLDTATFHNFKGSCAIVKERGDATTPYPKSYRRLDTYYGLYRSIQINNFLNIMPVTGLRFTNYTHTRNNTPGFTGDASVGRAQVGFDLVGRAFSVWDYKSERWKIDGIRHIVKPIVQYRYIFAGRSGSGMIPPIDYRVFRSHLEPLDLGVQRNIDTDQQMHKVRFGLQNYFQTKSEKYGAKNLASLSFGQDVCLHRRNNEERLSSFFTSGSFTPVDWFGFSASHHYHFKTHAYGLDTTTTITEFDAWKFIFGTTYRQDKDRRIASPTSSRRPINQVSIGWDYKFTERYKFGVTAKYDARIGQLLSHTYKLSSLVGNHWTVDYNLELARRGRYNHEATFLINVQCMF